MAEEEESQDEGEIYGRPAQTGHGLGMNLADAGLIHYSQAGSNTPGEGRAANGKKQGSYENEYVVGHIGLMVLGLIRARRGSPDRASPPRSATSANDILGFELWIYHCCRNWVMKVSNAGLSLSGANSKAASASATASSMRPNCW